MNCRIRLLTKLFIVFISLLLTSSLLLANEIPQPVGWINDFAGKIDQQVEAQLLNIITELREKTDFEIAVITIPSLEGKDINHYANEVYASWGIGSKNDEGILLMIAVDSRWIRIESGYGAEGYLPDGRLGEIRDRYLIPYLRQNDYDSGILLTVAAIANAVAQEKNVNLTGTAAFHRLTDQQNDEVNPLVGIVGFIFFIFLMIVTRGRILPWLLIFGMGGRGIGRSGLGGGFNRGGGFGGFGGFGGGASGGGGVSGRF